MSKVKGAKDSSIVLQEIEIIDDDLVSLGEEEILDSSTVSTPKKRKFKDSTTSTRLASQNVILNHRIKTNGRLKPQTTINVTLDSKMDTALPSHREDFFLKNENSCFYKCVFCLETVKSKPTYRSHLRMTHDSEMSKFHTQKGFIAATEEFCAEFIQTDLNIVQTLTCIFDQIENVDKIIRDHRKRLRSTECGDKEEIRAFLESEEIVLKFHSEMIDRAFDILTEKRDLVVSLQEDVVELQDQCPDVNQTQDMKLDVREEPQYELYYVVEDIKEDQNPNVDANVDESETVKTDTSLKRGRPKRLSARSLDDYLNDLPDATAKYIRGLTLNEASKFQCDVCEVTSKTKMLLCAHYMRVHFKIKNKICPECYRPFASQGDLTRHIRIHSGESPFKCEYGNCTSEFKTSGDLKKHKLVHVRDPSDRPFECDECESKFARLTDYRRHQKRHLIGKDDSVGFSCKQCNKIFYRKDLLSVHLNNHLNIKPFECESCLRRFAKKYDLLKHVEKHHQLVDCDCCGEQFQSTSKLQEHFSNGCCNNIG